jgi:integrase
MLRLIKKHSTACTKGYKEKDWKCVPKVRGTRVSCPFYIVGPDPRGEDRPPIKKYTAVSDERLAKAILFEFETSLLTPAVEAPPKPIVTTLDEAVKAYLATKIRRSEPRRKKLLLQLGRMVVHLKNEKYAAGFKELEEGQAKAKELAAFNRLPEDVKKALAPPEGLEKYNSLAIQDVNKTDLEAFMNTWIGTDSTLTTARENLKGFWKYCFETPEFHLKSNIAVRLPTIGDMRVEKMRKIPTLTPAEDEAILMAAQQAAKDGILFGRGGPKVGRQVLAFTYVEKYTAMSVGDVATLRCDALTGNSLFLHRKKTGEPVYCYLPDFVVEALRSFRPDSPEYFFWSGQGKFHTRTSKWGERLQKLYVAAGVRVEKVQKRTRSGGILKEHPELVKVSKVTPHWWRHTFVRNCYLRRPQPVPIETIADLLADEVDTVREYYSSFDKLRQEQLKEESASIWLNDPLTQRLIADHASSVSLDQSTIAELPTSSEPVETA